MTSLSSPELTLAEYDYELPRDLIARYPSERRDESRLLVLLGEGTGYRHLRFSQVGELLRPGDLLVLNESRVIPARLLGRKPTGAAAEILLLRPVSSGVPGDESQDWEALVRPGSKLKPGRRVSVAPELEVEIVDSTPQGGRIVRLHTSLTVPQALERFGRVPLPPYLDREDEAVDRERYQTVYARVPGSVAAPTAGLHFTPELLDRIQAAGVEVARILLHVGVGTFRPVEAGTLEEHRMHPERYEIPLAAARAVEETRERGGRVWAVGTTVVRALESAALPGEGLRTGEGETDLFIRPPYRFQVVDALLTNFHLPRSTLLMLVAALAGRESVLDAYREAVAQGYRFYSYGDAMAIPGS